MPETFSSHVEGKQAAPNLLLNRSLGGLWAAAPKPRLCRTSERWNTLTMTHLANWSVVKSKLSSPVWEGYCMKIPPTTFSTVDLLPNTFHQGRQAAEQRGTFFFQRRVDTTASVRWCTRSMRQLVQPSIETQHVISLRWLRSLLFSSLNTELLFTNEKQNPCFSVSLYEIN